MTRLYLLVHVALVVSAGASLVGCLSSPAAPMRWFGVVVPPAEGDRPGGREIAAPPRADSPESGPPTDSATAPPPFPWDPAVEPVPWPLLHPAYHHDCGIAPLEGPWRAALDLAGGQLRFALEVERAHSGWRGRLCNGSECQSLDVRLQADSVIFDMPDYAATITASWHGDSLVGAYHNVGNRGSRTIPFRAARGRWPTVSPPKSLVGRWDATYFQDFGTTPRVFVFRDGPAGLEGTIISNTGDYGHFSGTAAADSFSLAHFDGSFVYLLTGKLQGDTLRGVFHAGLRTQTSWKAVRSTGAPHLKSPTEVTGADTTEPFRFQFPDLQGHTVRSEDPRFRGKVVLVEIMGSWCPTCHQSAPELVRLYQRYHRRGLEIVGLAYEVTGDTSVDARQVRRYRDKFGIRFPLLLAGINDTDAAAATLPQLRGFTSFPTTIFLGRDGRVRRIHAGFYGPATGAQHIHLVREFEQEIQRLLAEPLSP